MRQTRIIQAIVILLAATAAVSQPVVAQQAGEMLPGAGANPPFPFPPIRPMTTPPISPYAAPSPGRYGAIPEEENQPQMGCSRCGIKCKATHNTLSSGNFCTEFTFAFSSSRTFFGEACQRCFLYPYIPNTYIGNREHANRCP